jgi:hypothetical protein
LSSVTLDEAHLPAAAVVESNFPLQMSEHGARGNLVCQFHWKTP